MGPRIATLLRPWEKRDLSGRVLVIVARVLPPAFFSRCFLHWRKSIAPYLHEDGPEHTTSCFCARISSGALAVAVVIILIIPTGRCTKDRRSPPPTPHRQPPPPAPLPQNRGHGTHGRAAIRATLLVPF
jgi:hypothetical protein